MSAIFFFFSPRLELDNGAAVFVNDKEVLIPQMGIHSTAQETLSKWVTSTSQSTPVVARKGGCYL